MVKSGTVICDLALYSPSPSGLFGTAFKVFRAITFRK